MALQDVLVTEEVYHACLQQALSTEREEILGMLMGRVTADSRAIIWGSSVVPRNDKRPDRVEIPTEQLCKVADEAEAMSVTVGQKTRVIGWYHSHPHITPYPSAVDLATQATCQLMEKCWVGLIFSVFNTDKRTERQRITLHCFATLVDGNGQNHHLKVPVSVVPASHVMPKPPPPLAVVAEMPSMLHDETSSAASKARARVETLGSTEALRLYDAMASMASAETEFSVSQLLVDDAAEGATVIADSIERRNAEMEAVLASLDAEAASLEAQVA
jgi:BRCA1/BRCA2-containing complex subunit 3